MVESTCFQHTSSHPDKNNNSVDRIISKEEEREDPRRELQSIFEYSGVSTFYKNYSVSTRNPATPSNSTYRKSRLLPATVPRVSKHSTRQNKAPGFPTAFQGHTIQAGFQ